MQTKFGTKSETLDNLSSVLKKGAVFPQIRFSVQEWNADPSAILKKIDDRSWDNTSLIVRSSSIAEDSFEKSLAGHFSTVSNVCGRKAIQAAVQKVIKSFNGHSPKDQIFIQPMLQKAKVSGVAFTRDPTTGAPYYVINYDDSSGETDTVTSGHSNDLTTFYAHKLYQGEWGLSWKTDLFQLLRELEEQLEHDALDVEFAVSPEDQLYLFQVRPLPLSKKIAEQDQEHWDVLNRLSNKISGLNKPHPYLHGRRTVFGIMPDWNPAEIIGVRPKPLALSLYKNLITDNIWAYQRNNYGYRNLRSFPLLISFEGLPYIDVRLSFNSFIPSDIDDALADRLTDHYIDKLVETPNHHDKVEFEIIYSCYTVDLKQRLQPLIDKGFSQNDCNTLAESLRQLTNNIIHGETGLWKKDTEKIEKLTQRIDTILESNLQPLEKTYWLIEDCKRYGTLPFAGLARAGFIAVQILKSLVNVEILSAHDYENFMSTLDTVSSQMTRDFYRYNREAFLKKYGHLRPGSYDIMSPRYDEAPDRYFDWSRQSEPPTNKKSNDFVLSLTQMKQLEKLLKEHQLENDIIGLFEFIKGAIEGREFAKFIFTKSLSETLSLLLNMGKDLEIDRSDLAFMDFNTISQLYASSDDMKTVLNHSIKKGKERYKVTQQITLPPLISSDQDVFAFDMPVNEPNFITLKSVVGEVVDEKAEHNKLKGNILMIPSADPGYDWIFSHHVGGFITMYGGTNSHMAIRAGELGVPAAIGVGEALYKQWVKSRIIEINCANRQVRILQ